MRIWLTIYIYLSDFNRRFMTNSLSKIDNPWLRIVTAASGAFAIITIVSAIGIGLKIPENKFASANKVAIYASLLATITGAVAGFLAGDASFKTDFIEKSESDTWKDWRNFVVDRKVVESQEITSFYLKPQDGGAITDFKPGQFLTIKLDIPEQERSVIRTYSISDYPPSADYYRLSIKREGSPKNSNVPPGIASNFMHDRILEGSVIACKPPNGKFFIEINSSTPAVLISNGVGITPMISMAKACVYQNFQRHIWFLHGARNGDYHACHQEMNTVENSTSNLHLVYSYSRPNPEDEDKYHTQGYIDKNLIEQSVIPEIERIYGSRDAEYYLCGSSPFMDSIRKGLMELGVPEDKVFFESFGGGKTKGKAESANTNSADTAEIVFASSARSLNWTKDDGTILEFAEANDINPPYSCRQGICLTCMCELKEGEVEYVEPPTNEPDSDSVLICISKPKTAKVVLNL